MIPDYLEIRNAEGMPNLSDANIALDFLLTAKNGIRNCAIALTESITPEVRKLLHAQLELSIEMHEKISKLMMDKGWLHPYNPNEQFHMDDISAQTALMIASMKLYPEDTRKLGLFATRDK